MFMALQQARFASEQGEIPVGAVAIAENGEVLSRAYNQVESLKDATAHAEMIALTQAASALGDWRLNEVSLYVTKEPCPMCAGAMVNSRLGHLYFGCYDPNYGAAGSVVNLLAMESALHRIVSEGGICEEECLTEIQDFFKQRRKENKQEYRNDR